MTRTPSIDSPAIPDPNGQTVVLRTARLSTSDAVAPRTFAEPTPPPWPSPRRIGSYEIRREVGRGGVGVVYEAYDPRLRRAVAVKLLKDAEPADGDMLRRFRTEAEAVAQLQHPHIVQVIEVGTSDGQPFVALEYLAGGSLHQRIAGQPQPPRGAAELVRTLAAATAHAHDHGVLHRDLKPGNILFTSDGTPKITDFGSARFFDPGHVAGAGDPGLTRAGEVIGTPQYMAPEQARGTPDAVGPAADVYALGAILYELLTGRPPHAGVDAYDVIHAVRTRDPIAPRRLQPRVPRDLETICLTCLEKDPKRRYASARALADDLGRFAAGDAIRARPAGPGRRAWGAARRRPAMAGLVVGLVVAGLAGTVAFVTQFRATVVARDAAEAKNEEAEKAHRETERKKAEAENHLAAAEWNLYCGTVTRAHLLLEKANTQEAAILLDAAKSWDRGWEWDYLVDRVESTLWRQPLDRPHEGAAWTSHAVLSPDGTRFAIAAASPYELPHPLSPIYDNPTSLTVLRVSDGAVVCRVAKALPGHARCLVWADDRTLAAADYRGRFRTWDAKTGAVRFDLLADPDDGESAPVVVASPDGWVLRQACGAMETFHASTPHRRTVHRSGAVTPHSLARGGQTAVFVGDVGDGAFGYHLRDLATGHVLAAQATDWFDGIFSPDGLAFLLGEAHGNRFRITCRASADGTILWDQSLGAEGYGGCRFSPEGRFVVVVTLTGELHTLEAATGRAVSVSRGFRGTVHDLTFSPDEQWLATVGDDGTTRVWDVATGALSAQYRDHRGSVRRVKFRPDGLGLMTAGADETVVCRDLTRAVADGGLMPPHHTGGEGTRMGALGFTSDGRLSILNTERGITEFDVVTGNPITRRPLDRLPLRDAKELRDYVVSADVSCVVGRVTEVKAVEGHAENVPYVAVWDGKTGARRRNWETGFKMCFTVAVAPDGSRVAAGGYRQPDPGAKPEPRLLIWDVDSGRLVADIPTDVPAIGLAFDPDGSRLAVGYLRHRNRPGPLADVFDRDGRATDVRIASSPVDVDGRFVSYTNVLKFSPDGRTLVGSCWGSSTVFVADAGTGALVTSIPQIAAITDLAFSPDGKRLAATGYTDVVTLYDTVRWNDVIAFVCVRGRKDDWAFPGLIAFSPDGRTLVANHWDGTFSLWNVPTAPPTPIGETLRNPAHDRATASAFRFHVSAARDAVRKNLPHAYRFHAVALGGMVPPTEALRDDWAAIRDAVTPPRIVPALAGGVAMPPP